MDFNYELFLNYLIQGLANGALSAFIAFTIVAATGVTSTDPYLQIFAVFMIALVGAMIFSASINFSIDRFAYRRLRNAPRLAPLICAIGISFILQQIAI